MPEHFDVQAAWHADGNASFRGQGRTYSAFLAQVTRGHLAGLLLKDAEGGTPRGRSLEDSPLTVRLS